MVNVATYTCSPGKMEQKSRRVPGPLVILGFLFLAIAVVSSVLSVFGVSFTASGGKRTAVLGSFPAPGSCTC
jgi:hypothetical protein